jgi:hypothetical protein
VTSITAPATVSDIVLKAQRDLSGQVPEHCLAETLHRLARQRLRR